MEETPYVTYRKPPTVGPTVRSRDWTDAHSPSMVPAKDQSRFKRQSHDFMSEITG